MTTTPALRSYQVCFDANSETLTRTVSAAYFVTDDDFTIFKDTDHKAVFAVSTRRVVSIERGALQPVRTEDTPQL
ncbi:hypothetical protein [Streptomyces goshikiensis]|uniref:hypothetical protein n=1 Tax=Streptomyces goshikiensis TaxID=1942 RepID=UPI0036C3FECA